MYYYGVKLHALAFRRVHKLPFPESILITPASVNDLTVFKNSWSELDNRCFFGDKSYCDQAFFAKLKNDKNAVMITPVKAVKGTCQAIKAIEKAANDLYSTAVSNIRQPIESFFNWLIEKTNIQKASKVRSSNGLLIHVFGKIAAAFICLIF